MFRRHLRDTYVTLFIATLLVGGCTKTGAAKTDLEEMSDSRGMTVGVGKPVPAAAETPSVGTGDKDAADDPEIWVDPKNPARGVIIGTDKKAGLYVYDLAGKQLQYLPGGMPNNVDLRGGFKTAAGERVLVAASDRGRPGAGAALFLLDPATLKLTLWGEVPVDLAEPYGLCLARRGAAFLVIVNGTDGQVRQHTVSAGADGKPVFKEERRFSVPTQPEGCVADDVAGRLYLGEEGAGIWRFDLGSGPAKGQIIAAAPSEMLKPDVEGLTLLREGAITWLIASSQGDSAFAVWRVDGPAPQYRGRFSVVANGGVDGVTGTDGVAAIGGQVGAFPQGLVVMQDDVDEGAAGARQNFKLVDWREVKKALGL
ncbi:MAG: phytase [Alphaproteobacteria bacterium]|nr:phytase [Alphaproteobacteria bacterium]MBU1513037.1 phytase [Alphaproteobacteria bacterium]MBU2095145.1 phytase [Alphaproteobacteria bacterium]MBU2152114.1 phytase [Alphaproteobacteria bacterium]MBU2306396.1 phytase [Alphaproteobacteria bacterium]